MSLDSTRTTVGLTKESHETLKRLKEDGVFNEMIDAYRCAIALAIASGQISPDTIKCETVFNVGSFDPDGLFRDAIAALYPNAAGNPYATAERLAEWGIIELGRKHAARDLRFTDMLKPAQAPK